MELNDISGQIVDAAIEGLLNSELGERNEINAKTQRRKDAKVLIERGTVTLWTKTSSAR